MSEVNEEIDIQLELKDRINFPYILQTTILNVKRAIASIDYDVENVENMMWDLFTDIPHSWYDEDFTVDVKKAFSVKTIDIRPSWGDTKLSIEVCEKYGYKIKEEIPVLNIYVLKNAIINLLHRRDMLVRKKKIEYSTGKNLKDTLEDLAEIHDEFDEFITTSEEDKIRKELEALENPLEEKDGDKDKSND